MKRKLLIITIMIMLMSSAMLFTACMSERIDIEGSAEVNFVFDKDYDNIVVSCPSAKVTIVDARNIKCSFSSLMPVEIILSADGKDNKSFTYSNDDLKAGVITENVTLDAMKYRVEFAIAGVKLETVPTAEGMDNISVEKKNGNTYVIVSDKQIDKDIILHFGDECYDYTIPAHDIHYTLGANGVVNNTIELVSKKDDKVIFVSNILDNLELYPIGNKNNGVSLRRGGTRITIGDYYVVQPYRNDRIYKLTKEELQGRAYFNFDEKLHIVELKDEIKDNVDVYSSSGYYAVDFYDEYRHHKRIIYNTKPLEPGTIISGHIYNNFNGTSRDIAHELTASEIESGELTLTNGNIITVNMNEGVVMSADKQYRVTFVDRNDVEVKDMKAEFRTDNSTTQEIQQFKSGDILKPLQDQNYVSITTIKDENGEGYELVDESYLIRDLFYIRTKLGKTKDIIDIKLVVDKAYMRRISFLEVNTNVTIFPNGHGGPMQMLLMDGKSIPIWLNGYNIVDDNFDRMRNSVVFDHNIYKDRDIVIKVEKQVNVRLNVTNREIFNGYRMNELYFKRVGVEEGVSISKNSNNMPSVNISAKDFGKTIDFYVDSYIAGNNGCTLIKFSLVVPKDVGDDDVIDITIEDIKDEWANEIY